MRRRLGWAVAAVLLLAVVGGRWLLQASPDQTARGEATAAALARHSAPVPEAKRWAETAAPNPVAAAASSPQQLADAQWCREPPEPEEPEEDAAASAPALVTPESYIEKLRAKPSFQTYNRAESQIRADWTRALAAQGGERAWAASEFLASASFDTTAASVAARDRLLARARTSRDGFVYALALERCNVMDRPVGCQGLSARQWAQLDPGNLQPWLREASRAQSAKDPQALGEAMFQIASSNRSQNYSKEFMALLLTLPTNDQPGLTLAVQTNLMADFTFAWLIPQFAPLTRWCDKDQQDANRAQTCGQIAEQLWVRADNLMEVLMATNIAKRVPAGQSDVWAKRAITLDAVRALTAAEMEMRSQEMERLPKGSPVQCVGLLRDNKMVRQRAAVGEWPNLLQRLKQSGITEAQQAALATHWRAERALQQAQAASASPVTKP